MLQSDCQMLRVGHSEVTSGQITVGWYKPGRFIRKGVTMSIVC